MGRGKPADPEKKMFFDTIKDMRKLIQKNTNTYTANTLGLGKNTKMPYDHLIGRRAAIKGQYKKEKARAHEESIQYDSFMNLLNSGLMKQRKEKDDFEKNKYKFSGASGGFGREQGGFLNLSKNDVQHIMGKRKDADREEAMRGGHFGNRRGGKGRGGGKGSFKKRGGAKARGAGKGRGRGKK